MKTIFKNSQGQVRNGWWILLFAVLTVLSGKLYTPVSRWLQAQGADIDWLGALSVLFLMAVTWICTRLMKRPFHSVGLQLNRRWLIQLGAGLLLAFAAVTLTVGLIWLSGGVEFTWQALPVGSLLIKGAYVALCAAIYEELLFRGFVFQRLIDGIGVIGAQLLLASMFAIGHWDNPGVEGVAFVIASIELAAASVVFGLAYIKTRSLALPIGLHFGWNWCLGQVYGFEVSGIEQTGLLHPSLNNTPVWLNGGSFGPEASVFAIVAELITIAVLLSWKKEPQRDSLQPSLA